MIYGNVAPRRSRRRKLRPLAAPGRRAVLRRRRPAAARRARRRDARPQPSVRHRRRRSQRLPPARRGPPARGRLDAGRPRLDQRLGAERHGGLSTPEVLEPGRHDRDRHVGAHLRCGVTMLVLEPVSVGLKFGFLAVLYLFLAVGCAAARCSTCGAARPPRGTVAGAAGRDRHVRGDRRRCVEPAEDFEPRLRRRACRGARRPEWPTI